MSKILFLQLAVMLVGGAVLAFGFHLTQGTISYLVGSGIVFFDLAILAWCWRNILRKKLIALVVIVIVLKYAFLALVIDWALTSTTMSAAWFCVGLGTVLFTVLGTAVLSWRRF